MFAGSDTLGLAARRWPGVNTRNPFGAMTGPMPGVGEVSEGRPTSGAGFM